MPYARKPFGNPPNGSSAAISIKDERAIKKLGSCSLKLHSEIKGPGIMSTCKKSQSWKVSRIQHRSKVFFRLRKYVNKDKGLRSSITSLGVAAGQFLRAQGLVSKRSKFT